MIAVVPNCFGRSASMANWQFHRKSRMQYPDSVRKRIPKGIVFCKVNFTTNSPKKWNSEPLKCRRIFRSSYTCRVIHPATRRANVAERHDRQPSTSPPADRNIAVMCQQQWHVDQSMVDCCRFDVRMLGWARRITHQRQRFVRMQLHAIIDDFTPDGFMNSMWIARP